MFDLTAGPYLICSLNDSVSDFWVQSIVLVHLCCCPLQDAERFDHLDLDQRTTGLRMISPSLEITCIN